MSSETDLWSFLQSTTVPVLEQAYWLKYMLIVNMHSHKGACNYANNLIKYCTVM